MPHRLIATFSPIFRHIKDTSQIFHDKIGTYIIHQSPNPTYPSKNLLNPPKNSKLCPDPSFFPKIAYFLSKTMRKFLFRQRIFLGARNGQGQLLFL